MDNLRTHPVTIDDKTQTFEEYLNSKLPKPKSDELTTTLEGLLEGSEIALIIAGGPHTAMGENTLAQILVPMDFAYGKAYQVHSIILNKPLQSEEP